MAQKLRIFLSSPGDVGLERNLATRVIERLQGEFAQRLEIETIRWEDRPMRATASFQPQIIPPSESDIVVCILWSRLGTPLSEEYQRADGTRFGSGTEWEFEDAVRGFRERGTPDLLAYRRTQEPVASLKDATQYDERRRQYEALEQFIRKWFFGDDGSFKAAFKTYESPDAFETTLETDLRRLLADRLPDYQPADEQRLSIRWHRGSPFRGLATYDIEHVPIFFGRTRAIADIKDALVRQAAEGSAFLIVFGMSGCGKSSLIRAGVLGTLTRPGVVEGVDLWRWCIFRPSDAAGSLCEGLAASLQCPTGLPELANSGVTTAELANMFLDAPKHALTPIAMTLRKIGESEKNPETPAKDVPNVRLLVIVDQLEEIFTSDKFDAEDRNQFFAALAALARSGHAWVMATMRSDYYSRCVEVPLLVELKEDAGQYDLLPPTFDEIGQMIAFPARSAGVRFEADVQTGRRLDAVLHEAAARDPQALPLLSFTLDELYRRRSDEGFLTLAAYDELGGLEGALALRAEEVFAAQPANVQETLPALLRGLVTVEAAADEIVAARRVPLAWLATTPERQTMLNALVAARLLVMDRTVDDQAVIRVAHEAMLTHWPRVKEWLDHDRDFLRIRSRLGVQADEWNDEGRRDDLLLPAGKPLAEAEDAVAQRREELDPLIVEFVGASLRRRKRRIVSVLAGTAILATALTAIGFMSYDIWKEAQAKTSLAEKEKEAAAQESKKAKQETQLSIEQQEQNKRRQKALDYEKALRTGREHILTQGNSTSGGELKQAIEEFNTAHQLATELAETSDEEERKTWLSNMQFVLLQLSDVYSRRQDTKNLERVLAERETILAKLPPELRERKAKTTTEFGEYRSTLVHLYVELAVANQHLKALLQQGENLKQAQGDVLAKAKSQENQPTPQEQYETNRKYLEWQANNLRTGELVARSTDKGEDRIVVAQLADTIADQYREVERFQDAEAFYARGVDILAPVFQPLAESLSVGGLGVNLEEREGGLYITAAPTLSLLLPHGLQENDQLLAVAEGSDGEWKPLPGISLQVARLLIVGKPGTEVRIQVRPARGEATQTVSIVRTPIKQSISEADANLIQQMFSLQLSIGFARVQSQDYAGARAAMETALEVYALLPKEHRDSNYIENGFRARRALANAYEKLKEPQRALELYRHMSEEGVTDNERVAQESIEAAISFRERTATELARLGDVDGGRAQFEKAVALARRLAATTEDNRDKEALAKLELRFAQFLEKYELLEAAQSTYEKSHETFRLLVEDANSEATFTSYIRALQRRLMLARKQDKHKAEDLQATFTAELRDLVAQLQALDDEQKTEYAYTALAQWYEALEDKPSAIEAQQDAMKSHAKRLHAAKDVWSLVSAYYVHSEVLAKLGSLEAADEAMAECLQAAKQIEMENADNWAALLACYVRAGDLKRDRKDAIAAYALYKQGVNYEYPFGASESNEFDFSDAYQQMEKLTDRMVSVMRSEDQADVEQALLRRLQLAEHNAEASEAKFADISVAETLVVLAEQDKRRGNAKQAVDHFEAALKTYEPVYASGMHDELFDEVASAMLKVCELQRQLEDDKAQQLADNRLLAHLQAWLDHPLHNASLLRKSEVQNDVAPWYEKLGEQAQALAAYRKSIELKEQSLIEKKQSLHPLVNEYFKLSLKAESLESLEAADQALFDCRRVSQPLLTTPEEACKLTLIFARSAYLKLQRDDRNGTLEMVRAVYSVKFPVDDDALMRRDGQKIYDYVTEVSRMALKLEAPDDIIAGYETRITLARRLADIFDDAKSLKQLTKVLGFYALWRKDREEFEQALQLHQQEFEAAEQLIKKEDTCEHQILLADALTGKGSILAQQKRYAECEDMRQADLDLRQKIFEAEPAPDNRQALYLGHYNLAWVANKQQKSKLALDQALNAAALLEPLLEDESNEAAKAQLAGCLHTLAWYQVLADKPDDAIVSATRALELNPEGTDTSINLLHGHLIRGEVDKAQEIFRKYHQNKVGGKSFTEVLRGDFKELRQRNLDRPAIADFENFLDIQQPKESLNEE